MQSSRLPKVPYYLLLTTYYLLPKVPLTTPYYSLLLCNPYYKGTPIWRVRRERVSLTLGALLTACYLLLTTLTATKYQLLLATCYLLLTTCLDDTAYCLLLGTAYYLLLATFYLLLLTTYYLLAD